MAHIESPTYEIEVAPAQRKPATESKAPVRSSRLKYYIHDSVESCRLQLLGELAESDVAELTGCWATAKTILGNRKILVDLRKLRTVDDAGRRWIISMANQGALLEPEAFLRNEFVLDSAPASDAKISFFTRLLAFFRGSRPLSPQSSTQAQ